MLNDMTYHVGKTSADMPADTFGHEDKIASFAENHIEIA